MVYRLLKINQEEVFVHKIDIMVKIKRLINYKELEINFKRINGFKRIVIIL